MKISLLTLFVLVAAFDIWAQSAQATFDEANTYYEQGQLSNAMNLYKIIEHSGQVSGALFLNMGITAVQMDSLGLAKYYFLKASQFEATEPGARKALEYVNSQFSRQSATLPKLPWDRAVDWLIEETGAFVVFVIGMVLISIGLFVLILYWFSNYRPNHVLWYLNGLIISGLLITGLSFYVDYVDRRYQEGIMIESSGRVLQNPDVESNLISIAYEGYNITVDKWKSRKDDGWFFIRLGNGQYGWIKNKGVKVL